MSYARFSEGDLYVFHHVDGFYCCMACRLSEIDAEGWYGDFQCYEPNEMLAHVERHEAAGHDVPARCMERLREEVKGER